MPKSIEMSGVLHEHGNNAKALVFQEKSAACFVASEALRGVLMPSVKNIRLYLLLFSIELQLKGLLLGGRVPIDDLKSRYHHNLENLYTGCISHNLIESDSSVKSILEKYTHEYGKDLRYYVGLKDVFGSSIDDESFVTLEAFYLKNAARLH